ncbi:RagB/SusD family nutrient uptake outer membrane protein [Microvirga sp. STR05]|uniref:RagB/SusD family nutrient uptake outer membrane protein n=1 Tax=Hymenobacter duratus TaxID=2771356 RepID=A0ABR8JIM5_9BACT|nr:RagB/SusD family nutrient uptake outer membrane protein [Hymenobacter duratus]MBD2715225.1 RagB/SusD family nutrient uptake outer membrane protein [Hymenobacter duratus]MBR7950132.1 RagB/SusD family nutrient uptake outer membrane protein [Microvirga sp. STR05]
MKPILFFRTALAAGALVGAAGLVTSCKDYLDVEPLALNTTEYTFSTLAGSTAAVIGAYDPLSGDQSYGTRVSMYFPYDSDEMIGSAGAADGGRRSIARYKALSTNSEITNPWNTLYQGVERSNICIQQIPLSPVYNGGSAADTAAMHRLHGEALTLRAQYYFELVRNWGDVPAQFTPSVSGQDFNLPNADRNATLARLVDDLALAQKLVPWRSRAGAASERITKGAVKALRARIALFRGGYSLKGSQMTRPTDYLDYYRIARQECMELMARPSEHSLNPSFLEVFKSINEQRSESANEIIFQVGMTGSTAVSDSKLGYYNGPRLQNASGIYGSTQGAVTVVPTYFYAFDSTDTRRDVTITTYGIASTSNFQSGVALGSITDGKFRRDWHSPPLTGSSNYLGYNWPIIRFADVLLMFAETENELNGPTAVAQEALLRVRTRAFAGNQPRAQATLTQAGFSLSSKASFFDALVNERYLEFGSEAIRKYDLLRWNLFATKLAEVKANIEKLAKGEAPYQNVPLYMYYRTPAAGNVQWTRSFYRPSPTPNTAPTGTVRVNWRQGIDAAYVANTRPAGATYTLGTTSATSTATGLAAEYVPGQGKELLPIPQSTLVADPALVQNFGY